jgi:hypothetical protein
LAAAGQPFHQSVVLADKPEVLMQGFVSASAGARGYTMNSAGNSLVLTRKYLPTWAIVVAIIGAFVFLIGLLALLIRNTETLTVALAEADGGGTRLTISGLATPEMIARLNGVISGAKPLPQQT